MQVTGSLKGRSSRLIRSVNSLAGIAMFVAPLLALVAIWAAVVPLFNVNPRVFPSVGAVGTAALDSIRDGTLLAHVGASLLRVALGTLIGIATAVPLGIAMGVSPTVAAFLTPLFRFFSVLAGIAWIPIATLWFGYGFGAIVFVIFNAVFFVVAYNTLLGVRTIPHTLRNAAASLGAGRWALLTEVLPWVQANGETIEKFLAAVSEADQWMRKNPKLAAQVATRWIPGLKQEVAETAMQFNIQQADRRLSANNYRALWSAEDRLARLGILKSTFDVNAHIEPKHILKVMKDRPELFADLPPIPATAAITPGYVFKP